MQHRGGVGAGVDSRHGIEYRFAKIGIPFRHRRVHGFLQQFARKHDVLAYFGKDDAHTRVLADGVSLRGGETRVFAHFFESELRRGRSFRVSRFFQRRKARRLHVAADGNYRFFYLGGYYRRIQSEHTVLLTRIILA